MLKIYNANGEVAWIGESAPVPAGWSKDINEVKEKSNGVRKEEVQEGRQEEVTEEVKPKRRGRRKLGE